ncbi:pilus assembly protein PilM [Desulfosporosinus sp. Sb-LF]|uniref:type IV pilus biogenesis protein PilM n=1 Tax=Desulfosporosinus sp. Sb-LF TaxID=2560027 RepID=UPI00107F23D4|nr:pilus assembly protein PilM [Desulfosporosinus sp. Sb-LF]TGE34214.1 competence protein ComA [Desulfosporosinus sp. Sb-LF]
MRNDSVVFELTDGEIRAFWFSVPPFIHKGHSSNMVKFDRIPISAGLIEQGNVRDENALINILLTYTSHQPCKGQKVYLAIPLQQGFIRAFSLPWLPKRDRKSAVSLLVDEEIPIVRADLLYDFLVILEEKNKSLQVLLGATRKSILEQYVFIFRKAGFKVEGIDFAFFVLGQALGFQPKEDVLYLHGESDCFQIALFEGMVPESVHTIPPFAPLIGGGESLKERLEALENEIHRFLLYYRTQQTDLNLKRLVWSGDSITDQLAQRVLASGHVSIVEQALLKGVPESWQRVLEENKGWSEVVVGYGLRISTQHPELNLWRQPNKEQRHRRTFGGLAFFSAALLLIVTIGYFVLNQMTLPLRQEVPLLSRQGVRIEEQARHREKLEDAWKKVKIHPERIGEGLAQVQALSGQGLKIEQVMYKQGSLSLSARADEYKGVQNLISTMRGIGWEQPALTSYKLTELDNVEFTLSAKRGKAEGG